MPEYKHQSNDFSEQLRQHTEQEDSRFKNIENQLGVIRENHLAHIETDVQALKMQGAGMTADLGWLKWGMLAVLGALIAGSIGLIFVK